MNNNELVVLLSLAKSTLSDKKEGIISNAEANKVFFEINNKLKIIDDEISKSLIDQLISRIEF